MPTTRTTDPTWDGANGIGAALTGIGVLTLALFPLAIPILVLTAAFLAPLALLGLVGALVVGVIAGVVFTIRATSRWVGSRFNRDRRREHQPQPAR